MSQVKVFHFEIMPELDQKTLKEAVYLFLNEIRSIEISKREVKTLIDSGKVHRNTGKCFKSATLVEQGDKVLVELPRLYLKRKDESIEVSCELNKEDIVYQDSEIVVVHKVSGLSTGPSLDPKRDHLFAAVKRYLQKSQAKEVYVGLHHRLDVDTSGLVLFTKKRSVNKAVSDMFAARKIKKKYLCLCFPPTVPVQEGSWEIRNHLGRKEGSVEKKELRMTAVHSGGDFAHTIFRVLSPEESKVLIHIKSDSILNRVEKEKIIALEAQPLTGRTHQIRVHLYEQGMPILGDRFYTHTEDPLEDRLCLHAYSLEFPHPKTGELLSLKAPFIL